MAAPSAPRHLILLAALAFPAHSQLVRDWHTIQTPHFEAISRYDPARLTPLLTDLEWCYSVFQLNLNFRPRTTRAALVLIPDSPFDYEQLSPAKYAGGYYLGAPWRDLIVLRDILDARHAFFHELAHLALQHEGGRFPVWFNEGNAEYFAEMRPAPTHVEAGPPDRRRINVLAKGAWVPAAYLTTLKSASELNSSDAVHRFYAQSWLYVHMLRLNPAYAPAFPQFRDLLKQGIPAEEALQKVYTKSLVQFDNDARQWIRAPQWPTEKLKAPTAATAPFTTTLASTLDIELAKALAASGRPPSTGATRSASAPSAAYVKLAQLAGDACPHQAALGDLAFSSRLMAEASAHYQRALACGVDVSSIAHGLESSITYRERVPPSELEKVARLTGSVRSQYLLGVARFFDNDFAGAVESLAHVTGLSHNEQFRAQRVRTLALYKLDRHAEALAEAKRLFEMAESSEERQTATITIQDIERDTQHAETRRLPAHEALLRNLSRIDGFVTRVDCLGERARFTIQDGAQTVKLIIADPNEVISGGEDAKQLEFSCGPQKRAITVGYTHANDPATATTGRIKYLVFR